MMKVFLKFSLTITMAIISLTSQATAEPLTQKQQSIVTISAYTATGNLEKLNPAINQGLDNGLAISEIKEVLVHIYAYAGFPRSLNGISTFMKVLEERKAKGINDPAGKEASPITSNKSKYEYGNDNLEKLVGRKYSSPINDFAPAIDQFLKEHLFGDVFGRDVLDYKTRELVTVSVLASMTGTENQLRSHLNTSIYQGLTKEQLQQMVAIIGEKVSDSQGNMANKVLQSIINPTETAAIKTELTKRLEPFEGTFRKGTKTENKNFSGAVYVNYIVPSDSVFNMSMATVTFEPGVRTSWHKHASGQILVITDGTAYYQEKGKPKQMLQKGDVAKCPPNVEHWHGASPHGPMTHLASSPNLEMGPVIWLEKVSDEEYHKK